MGYVVHAHCSLCGAHDCAAEEETNLWFAEAGWRDCLLMPAQPMHVEGDRACDRYLLCPTCVRAITSPQEITDARPRDEKLVADM